MENSGRRLTRPHHGRDVTLSEEAAVVLREAVGDYERNSRPYAFMPLDTPEIDELEQLGLIKLHCDDTHESSFRVHPFVRYCTWFG
jgi:hypothetical protein